MSKHEIRMRRQRMTAHGSERFRNYGAILERHEQVQRMKKVLKVFTYFLVILIIVMMIVIIVRVERKVTTPATTALHQNQPDCPPRLMGRPDSHRFFDAKSAHV